MNQPNTTAWSKAVCTATSNFFTCRTPCSCGWKTPCFSCNTDHLNIDFSNMFPDTGLALRQTCQSGIWKTGGGSTVETGLISNGQQIPLPPGFNPNQCMWSVSNAQNPHGWKPNYYAGSVAWADSNRIVKCGYYDEFNFFAGTNRTDLSGQCSYVVSCQ